jgi:hypothetical protein
LSVQSMAGTIGGTVGDPTEAICQTGVPAHSNRQGNIIQFIQTIFQSR